MNTLERRVMVANTFKGILWAFFEIDIPEWTSSEFCHQN